MVVIKQHWLLADLDHVDLKAEGLDRFLSWRNAESGRDLDDVARHNRLPASLD